MFGIVRIESLREDLLQHRHRQERARDFDQREPFSVVAFDGHIRHKPCNYDFRPIINRRTWKAALANEALIIPSLQRIGAFPRRFACVGHFSE